jgi:hypothetical protein
MNNLSQHNLNNQENQDNNIEVIQKINSIEFASIKKNFILLKINESLQYSIFINSIEMPFGIEMFNSNKILNIEFRNDNNQHYNVYTHLLSIDEKIIDLINSTKIINLKQIFNNKTFVSSIKESMLGHLLRTHITSNSEIYILSKNKSKIILPNINKCSGNVKLTLRGLWYNDLTFGLYWIVNSVNVTKM